MMRYKITFITPEPFKFILIIKKDYSKLYGFKLIGLQDGNIQNDM